MHRKTLELTVVGSRSMGLIGRPNYCMTNKQLWLFCCASYFFLLKTSAVLHTTSMFHNNGQLYNNVTLLFSSFDCSYWWFPEEDEKQNWNLLLLNYYSRSQDPDPESKSALELKNLWAGADQKRRDTAKLIHIRTNMNCSWLKRQCHEIFDLCFWSMYNVHIFVMF